MIDANALDFDGLVKLANSISKLHEGQESQRKLSENFQLIGLLGEWAFAKRYGLPFNDARYGGAGDPGYDFEVFGLTIDVKTAVRPVHLFREVNLKKPPADLYVLAGVNFVTRLVSLKGWEWTAALIDYPIKNYVGIDNYAMPAKKLKPMPRTAAEFWCKRGIFE